MQDPPAILTVRPPRRPFWGAPRLWIGLAVAAAWGTMMYSVWRNETERAGATLREIGISREVILSTWDDTDQWTAIEKGETWLGGGRVTIQIDRPKKSAATAPGRPALPEFHLFSRVRLRLPVFTWSLPADLQMRVEMNSALEVKTIVSTLMLAGQQANMEAFVEGGSLYYRLRTGGIPDSETGTTSTQKIADGQTTESRSQAAAAPPAALPPGMALPIVDLCGRSPLKGPIVLSDSLMPILSRSEKFKEGAQWTARVANPLFGQLDQPVQVKVEGRETISVGGRNVEAWRTNERLGQISTTAWYSDQGESLRRELSNGLVMSMASPKQVLAQEPLLRRDLPMAKDPDKAWIRAHLDPELEGKPLESLLPRMPGG